MHEPGPRPFTVLDAAVLTGASAIGLALISYNDESWWLSLNALVMIARLGEFHWFDLSLLANVLLGLTPLLAAWTVALLGLRLLPPRPLEIELFRQPGMVACHAATWTILVATLFVVFAARRNGTSPLADLTRLLPPSIGLAVAASWLLLALSRQWRREESWIDHCGFLAGLAWVQLLLLFVWVWLN